MPASSALSGTWLVLVGPDGDDGLIATEVISGLARHGARPAIVEVGPDTTSAWLSSDLAQVATASSADGAPVAGVLSLVAVASPEGTDPLAVTMAVTSSVPEAGLDVPLWYLTRGAVAVADGDPEPVPAQQRTWRLGLAMGRRGGAVDLPADVDEEAADRLVAVLSGTVPPQVAIRSSRVFVCAEPAGTAAPEKTADRSADETRERILRLVREATADATGQSAAGIAVDAPFLDLGLDSAKGLVLYTRIGEATGLKLSPTLIFDHPTPELLAGAVAAQLLGTVPASAPQDRREQKEPIAIVGIGCRYPGNARSPEDLWELMAGEVDAIGEFPATRDWEEGLYDPDPDRPGKSYTREGGFLYDADEFDPAFFGISPREAIALEPQQRLLLETAWEALERAGIDPGTLRGTRTGVFAGAIAQEYSSRVRGASAEVEGYLGIGSTLSVVSGRVSYALGLEGPAVTVDTACSSSLVALHLACQSLHDGESDLALAGGVTVLSAPGAFVMFSRQRALARDGRSKAFSAEADGMGMAEGVGLLVLERLSDAERNGHQVLAVVRGSAVNQDGASNGLTAPHGPSQERVIRAALASADLDTGDVDTVEAHGTGTALGDPIEARALIATYGQGRPDGRPLWLGSVKSNIGHTQAAAGVAGIIKIVECLRHGVLPKTLHAENPTAHVDWSAGDVRLLQEPVPWPAAEGRPRRAGVSSFGVSGTNAHLIVEEAPVFEEKTEGQDGLLGDVRAWLVSGKSTAARAAQADALADWVHSHPHLNPRDVAWSLVTRRAAFGFRAVVTGRDRDELLSGLRALGQGEPGPGVVTGTARPAGRVAFVFPGQGSQWIGMAAELLKTCPPFAERVAECDRALAPWTGWSVTDVLRGEAGAPSLERDDVIQPALFTMMVALAQVWRAAGAAPDAVVGHSQGEIAAACVAGVLSVEDAARIVAVRSKLVAGLAEAGGMASIGLPYEKVAARLADCAGVSVAADNGPTAVVISGDAAKVAALVEEWQAREVRARLVPVAYASHSPYMDQLREELQAALDGIVTREPAVAFCSSVTGGLAGREELAEPGYWFRNLREPVEFRRATQALLEAGYTTFIEVSAHPVLAMAVEGTAADAGRTVTVTGTLRRDEGDLARFALSAATVFASGAAVDWMALLGRGSAVDLPTYAFQRERYWLRSTEGASDVAAAGLVPGGHRMLGAMVRLAGDERGAETVVLTGRAAVSDLPWLRDHQVTGTVLLPGTALADMALHAGLHAGSPRLTELTLRAPVLLPAAGGLALQVTVAAPGPDGTRPVTIHSRPESDDDGGDDGADWTCHAEGTLSAAQPAGPPLAQWPPAQAQELPVAGVYDDFAEAGLTYGPAFRGLERAWRGADGTVYAEAALPSDLAGEVSGFGVHPALLDASLHVLALADGGVREPKLPFSWSGVQVHASGAVLVRVAIRVTGQDTVRVDVADAAGDPVASVAALTMRPLPKGALTGAAQPRDALFAVTWVPVPAPEAGTEPGAVAVLGDAHPGLAERSYPDLAALAAAVEAGAPAPDLVVASVGDPVSVDGGTAAEAAVGALELVQGFFKSSVLNETRLLVLSRGAVAAGPGGDVADLNAAAAHGLIRSAQTENPDRIVLVDLPALSGAASSGAADGAGLADWVRAAAACGEPEVAVRDGQLLARRLIRPRPGLVPADGPWRLAAPTPGSLDQLALVPLPEAEASLEPGQVRVAIRAAGLNFRDVLIALGMYPGLADLGAEVAGVVTETGPGVTGLAPGTRVMGLAPGAIGPVAVADAKPLAPMPEGWSFAQAAGTPVAFLTAYYGLVELGRLAAGDRVLIHAAAGGVGMAAVQIARWRGAEVFATASPGKHPVLARMGLDPDHIASSRDLDFERKFAAASCDNGMDVVLNALAGEFTDASLRLLAPGGRFIEMGKTDPRDPADAAAVAGSPGVTYRAFDLMEAGPDRLGEFLAVITGLLASGDLAPLPVRAWDVRRAPDAFRFMSQARHTGKMVLTIPPLPGAPRRPGTLVITGGTGVLGALAARRLAADGKFAQILLLSRSGPAAAGVPSLAQSLAQAGVAVRIVACDTGDRSQLAAVLDGAAAVAPATSVIHAAGALDDGTIASLTPDRVEAVMRPKAGAAWHLHELTAGADLESFVLYSSGAAALGSPGQGNYAAANAFLDALAVRRQTAGLPAVSLGWGLWDDASGLTGHLGESDRARITQTMSLLSASDGLALLEAGIDRDEPHLIPVPFRLSALRAAARNGALPSLFTSLVAVPARQTAAAGAAPGSGGDGLRAALDRLGPAERDGLLREKIQAEAAAVLGHASPDAIDPEVPFTGLGFDSLTAVELRNRLTAATGLTLPATVIFDHPTAAALARHLRSQLSDSDTEAAAPEPDEPLPGDRRYVSVTQPDTTPAASAAFLRELYLQASRAGRTAEIMPLIKNLAAFRPLFTGRDDLANLPGPLRIASGPQAPRLICLPSFAGRGGSEEYARFAGGFGSARDVRVLPAPGYLDGEPLPATVEALIAVHAESIAASADGAPFALVGHSSGGMVAHRLAAHLERSGTAPAAVVLLDTYSPDRGEMSFRFWSELPRVVLENSGDAEAGLADAWLTAVTHYFSLDWKDPGETSVPTLLVRATERVRWVTDEEWMTAWEFSSQLSTVDVPGDHFTMMADHADTTAAAVHEWLTKIAEA